jgi:AraC-like DNA-binding protein
MQSVLYASLGLERHYSVSEIAKMWALSEKTVRRMFEDEEGVLQRGSPETRRKRGYITLRIPESVMLRVHHQRARRAG